MSYLSSRSEDPQRQNLKLLFYLRWIAIFGQLTTILCVNYLLGMPLTLLPMLGVLVFQSCFNLLTFFRVTQGKRISDPELFIQLLLDTAMLTIQLYYSGGSSNPFTGLYLLQVIIAATILPQRYTWGIVVTTIGCYLLLVPFNIPIPHLEHNHMGSLFSMHLQGMLVGYVLSAVLIAFFVVRMAKNLKIRDQWIAEQKEQAKAQGHILHMGILAAGAAHELGTPLSVIATLSGEIREDLKSGTPSLQELSSHLNMLDAQVQRCTNALRHLTLSTDTVRAENAVRTELDSYLKNLIESWRQASTTEVSYHFSGDYIPIIAAEKVLDQAIWNLLDNAANALASQIEVHAQCSKTHITLHIDDNGCGIDSDIIKNIGKPIMHREKDSTGLGLFLTHTVIKRLEGTLALFCKENGRGTKATITLPLSTIAVG